MLQRIVLPLVLAAAAQAGGATIYGDPTATVYPTIQGAVDSAPEGALILVGTGTFNGFVVDGKSLAIASIAPPFGTSIQGSVTIRNLGASQRVLLDNFAISALLSTEFALEVESCAGDVRLQRDYFFGKASDTAGGDGGPGVNVFASSRVTFVDDSVLGGSASAHCGQTGGHGGDGIVVAQSRVAIYHSTIQGGRGGDGANGGDGGDALEATASVLIGCHANLKGANGGDGCGASPRFGGDGGNGVTAHAGCDLRFEDYTPSFGGGGAGWPAGNEGSIGVDCTGPYSYQPTISRTSTVLGRCIVLEGESFTAAFTGISGEDVYVGASETPAFLVPATGVMLRHLPIWTKLPSTPTFQLDSSAWEHLPVPFVAPGKKSRVYQLQTYGTAFGASSPWGEPMQLIVLENAAGLDCDGSGRADVIEIIEGTLLDQNGDTIADLCSGPQTFFVDPAAAPGGNGSASAPFRSLAESFVVATSGDTILLADGVYSGPENRDLSFDGRDMTVRSQHGPTACIVDCGQVGRAFSFADHESAAARLDGVTIRNASLPVNATLGGAGILISSASPTIANCVFENCAVGNPVSQRGGAIGSFGGPSTATIEDCRFVGCPGDGAVVWINAWAPGSLTRIVRSTFEANGNSSLASAVLSIEDCNVSVVRCRFLGNQGAVSSAIECDETSGGVLVEGSLFAVNQGAPPVHVRADDFGALFACRVVDCTFADNSHAALELDGYVNVLFHNSIAWDPNGPGVPAIRLLHWASWIQVAYSNVRNGIAGIERVAGAFDWSNGNVSADPQFVNSIGPDGSYLTWSDNVYRLKPTSPCIDAGDNTIVPPDAADLDGDGDTAEPVPLELNGKPRFTDLPSAPDTGWGLPPLVDIGCYERQG